MNRIAATFLSAFALAACSQQSAVEVDPPEWAQRLRVDEVSESNSRLTASDGNVLPIAGNPENIGDGLTAYTRHNYLYVTAPDGIRCKWDDHGLSRCEAPRPLSARPG